MAAGTDGPTTPEGKFLALSLCAKGLLGEFTSKPLLFKKTLMSLHLGRRAYKDLERCGWIQDKMFKPEFRLSRNVSLHHDAQRHVISCQKADIGYLSVSSVDIELSVNNRLLMAILLDYAEESGLVTTLGNADIAGLTGFTKNQVMVQLQKMKEWGLISGVISGVTGTALFGVAKNIIYINPLHPLWGKSFAGWQAIPLPVSLWNDVDFRINDFFKTSQRVFLELGARPELRRRLECYVLLRSSYFLTSHWSELRLSQGYGLEKLEKIIVKDRVIKSTSGVVAMAIVISSLSLLIYEIAGIIQKELLTRKDDIDNDRSFRFLVLPPFSGQAQGVTVLTNSSDFVSVIDASWLSKHPIRDWISCGLASDPKKAPKKYRSKK